MSGSNVVGLHELSEILRHGAVSRQTGGPMVRRPALGQAAGCRQEVPAHHPGGLKVCGVEPIQTLQTRQRAINLAVEGRQRHSGTERRRDQDQRPIQLSHHMGIDGHTERTARMSGLNGRLVLKSTGPTASMRPREHSLSAMKQRVNGSLRLTPV